MTKNFHRDGAPDGLHAATVQSPDGIFGVALIYGRVLLMFISEDGLADYLAAAAANPELDAGITKLIGNAAKLLPGFKATCLKVASAQMN